MRVIYRRGGGFGLVQLGGAAGIWVADRAGQTAPDAHRAAGYFALNAQVCASFMAQKDGAPNALSPWLQQYLRAQGGEVLDTERIECTVVPQVQPRNYESRWRSTCRDRFPPPI